MRMNSEWIRRDLWGQMKLEHIAEFDPSAPGEDLIRLFDFSGQEVKDLKENIKREMIELDRSLDLSTLPFIDPINCGLVLRTSETDLGIRKVSSGHFDCHLTKDSYQRLIELIKPFVQDKTDGFQWLYDLGSDLTSIEFLITRSGTW